MQQKFRLSFGFAVMVVASAILLSCGRSPYPASVKKALEQAGDNRKQLEVVLDYFASWNDSLKIQAAYYLIGNMEDHCYAVFGLFDTTGQKIDFDASTF
jgi:sugar/nucleoside kinase (ribokinase family)